MKLKYVICFLIAAALLSSSAYAAGTQVQKSYSGSFNGTNNPTITVGGNCPPLNVRMDVTGKCEGTVCTKNPQALVTQNISSPVPEKKCVLKRGYEWQCGAAYADLPDCPVDAKMMNAYCSHWYYGTLSAYYCNANEGTTSTGKSCCPTSAPYYNETDGKCYDNNKFWNYQGLVLNTTTVPIPIGINSNPTSSSSGYVGTKIPVGNLRIGGNTFVLSAIEKNAFNYTIYWTQENVTGSGDLDGDGYYNTGCTLGNDCNDNDKYVNPGKLEVPGNGKDDNCDGYIDSLFVNSIDDITKNCPYNTTTATYNCSGGWNNLYFMQDISLPVANCWTARACRRDGELGGCNPRNIVLKANNEFSAKNIYTTNYGGYGGHISIEAKKITATSLNTYGTTCKSTSCSCGGPFCGNSNGGNVTLKADVVNVTTINANQGGGASGNGGTVTIITNKTIIKDIYSNGGGNNGCGNNGYGYWAGGGGNVNIKSSIASINTISLNAGYAGDCTSGYPGGIAKLSVDNLTLGSISANGGYTGGKGGTTKIYTDNYTIGSITENGANGHYGSNCEIVPGSGGFAGIFSDSKNTQQPTITLNGGVYRRCIDSSDCPDPNPIYASNGIAKSEKRSASGFFVFETNLSTSGFKSYILKIKDSTSGTFVNNSYGTVFEQYGTIQNKYIKALVGRMVPLKLKMGKDYQTLLKRSSEFAYNTANCGITATCDEINVPFTRY